MRETKIEGYLREQVARAGGTTRKFKSPGHANVPDQIVIWPYGIGRARIIFVETKAPHKTWRAAQVRERDRLVAFGCEVRLVNTREAVLEFVKLTRSHG